MFNDDGAEPDDLSPAFPVPQIMVQVTPDGVVDLGNGTRPVTVSCGAQVFYGG